MLIAYLRCTAGLTWARRKSLQQKPHLTQDIAIWKEIVLFSVLRLCRRGRSALTKYQFQVIGTKHFFFNQCWCLLNLTCKTHFLLFLKHISTRPVGIEHFPERFHRSICGFFKLVCMAQMENNLCITCWSSRSKITTLNTHIHTSLYILTHFLLYFLFLNLLMISHGNLNCCKIEFLSTRRSHFWDLWTLHNFKHFNFPCHWEQNTGILERDSAAYLALGAVGSNHTSSPGNSSQAVTAQQTG